MKTRLLLLLALLLPIAARAATTYTSFYMLADGDNKNSGSTTNVAALSTYAAGTWDGTSIFTVGSGNPVTDANIVPNVSWASVYTTGAATNQYTALITGTNATTITLSTTHFGGLAATPSTGAGGAELKIGGAWKGPNAGVQFPIGYPNKASMTDNSSHTPRFNFMNTGGTFAVTAAMTENQAGPYTYQGCDTIAGDGTKATIDGAGAGASFAMLTISGANIEVTDMIFSNNGPSGTSSLVTVSANENSFNRCVFHDAGRSGLAMSAPSSGILNECEAYACNKNNAAGVGAFTIGGITAYRCIAHDNTGGNVSGFVISEAATLVNCISDTNGKDGMSVTATTATYIIGCDFYNNSAVGVDYSGASATQVFIENCNFVKNTTAGIKSSGSSTRNGSIYNCGFGAGTQANGTDIDTSLANVYQFGNFSYTADALPWVDAPNGNFKINLAAAKGAGRGVFTETAASYTGTVAYPDVGAAQHQETASGASYIFIH